MNVLVISNAAWDDKNSLGNTLSNWFSNWSGYNFSCITYRSDSPQNNCCSDYFVIPPLDVIRCCFSPNKIGVRYDYQHIPSRVNKLETMAKGATGVKRYFFRIAVDLIYKISIWRNKKYKQFLNDINPDFVFLFAIPESFVYENVKYIKKHYDAKIIMSVEDDLYGIAASRYDPISLIGNRRIRRMFGMADKLYGASQMMCDSYSKWFGLDFTPIFKGCEFGSLKEAINEPVEIVYAGNLLYGRLETLSEIAKSIRIINDDRIKIKMSVFSGTKLSKEQINCINDGASVVFYGVRPFSEIEEVLRNADITLHVESFHPEMQKLVRYSFSTKIIDCLQSGNTMMVVGPPDIASVEYPRAIPGAIVVDDINNILNTITNIVSNPNSLLIAAKEIRKYARKYHEINSVRKKLIYEFEELKK